MFSSCLHYKSKLSATLAALLLLLHLIQTSSVVVVLQDLLQAAGLRFTQGGAVLLLQLITLRVKPVLMTGGAMLPAAITKTPGGQRQHCTPLSTNLDPPQLSPPPHPRPPLCCFSMLSSAAAETPTVMTFVGGAPNGWWINPAPSPSPSTTITITVSMETLEPQDASPKRKAHN